MEELNSWKLFEMTGSVKDYLNYRQTCSESRKRNEANECDGQRRDNRAGDDSSQYPAGGL